VCATDGAEPRTFSNECMANCLQAAVECKGRCPCSTGQG